MLINLLLQYFSLQHILSRLAAKLANCRTPFVKNFLIVSFSKFYRIDMSEAQEPNHLNYPTFNDFFSRTLKPNSRPIENDQKAIISPVDGKILQIGRINNNQLISAKGKGFTVEQLLADSADAALFSNGSYAVVYLAPYNYHRIHMPLQGKLTSMRYIPGKLFSVNPKIVNLIPNIFAKNERVVTLFETSLGPAAVIFVGAIIVGSIETTWDGVVSPNKNRSVANWDYQNQNIAFAPGDEIGSFKLGSTVIMLFPEKTVAWSNNLQIDTPVKMGQAIGTIL